MRVLVVSHMYPHRFDPGGGVFIHRHVKALQKHGCDVKVVAPIPWAPKVLGFRRKWKMYADVLHEPAKYDGVEVHRLAYPILPGALNFVGGVGLAMRLRRWLASAYRSFPFELLHAHTITPDGFASCYGASALGVPVVCSIRGSDLNVYPKRSPIVAAASKWVLKRSSAVIAVSAALADEARRFCGRNLKADVIYNGVDTSIFYPAEDARDVRKKLGMPCERRVVLFVGRVERDKGVGELVTAYDKIRRKHRDLSLVIVGEGSFLDYCRQSARQGGWEDELVIAGAMDQMRLGEVYRASDFFVLPSYSEGMPNALLEAMASRLAVICSAVGGVPEVLVDKESGLLVPPKHADSVAEALGNLLENFTLARQYAAEAANKVARMFSWSSNAEQHAMVYSRTVQTFPAVE